MNFLRQSTAVDIGIGPFVDSTDGVTAETGLTISQADVRLKKNNGAWAQVNDATSAAHEENGWYEKELDATDTNTVGILLIAVAEAGALPVWLEFQVVEEAVFDALFAASALGYVANAPVTLADAVAHGGTLGSSTATLALSRLSVVSQSANTNAVTATGNGTGHGIAATSGSGATGNGMTLLAASTNGHGLKSTGTGTGDGAELTAGASGADLDSDIAGTLTTVTTATTTTNLTNAPTNGDFTATMKTSIGTAVAASAVASVTGNVGGNVVGSVASVVGAVGSVTGLTASDVGAIKAKTDNLPSDPADQSLIIAATDAVMSRLGVPAGDSVSADVAAVKVDTAAVKAKTDNLPSDPADASVVAGLIAASEAKVDAVKAKTDSLTFTVAGQVNSNIISVIGNAVQENGAVDTNWGGTP